ncbi:MAG: response regulator [Pseudomonadota bacterium]
MSFFSNLSLSKKLVVISVGTAAVSLLLATASMSVNQAYDYRMDLSRQMVTVANAIGSNNVAAITFEDGELGEQALSTLSADTAFMFASLYDASGAQLASYRSAGFDDQTGVLSTTLLARAVDTRATVTSFHGFEHVDVIEPVVYEDNTVGYIHIRASLNSVIDRLKDSAVFVAALLIAVILFAVVLSLWLQGVVSKPILQLIAVTRQVRNDGDYSARSEYRGRDEIGTLVNDFHEMLDQLGERDQVLKDNQSQLAERSASLEAANSELKKAIDESVRAMQSARAASQAKSEFLARMSHEIRTPMNGVVGMLELLERTPLDRDQKHYVTTIDQSAETLLAVINDILDFSKIEAGRLLLEKQDLHVRECVESVVELLASRAHEKGVEMVCHIDASADLTVCGDGVRLRQILMNLVANAIKFTEHGEIKVSVTALSDNDSAATLRFSIVDTGIGIREENLDAIFDSFSQEDGGTTRRYGGTGLGLAISRELVKLMDGEIGVDSVLGDGSEFWFDVPFNVLARDRVVLLVEQLAERRVLVVDDNATNREMLVNQLINWDMQPTAVDGAVPAIQSLEIAKKTGQPYDIILLDWHMPDVDGVMFATQLSRSESFRHIPIILLTSASVSEILDENGDAQVDAYITKPVRQARLRDAMLHILGADNDPVIDDDQTAGSAEDPLHGRRVLLVEDNHVNQEVAKGMLHSLGITVELAKNGEEALAALSRGAFDVVLMDCQMPVMDGYQATREIRQREGHTDYHQVVVALTANALPEDREQCLEAGMDDYLAKPFTVDRLRELLLRSIGTDVRQSA